MHLYEASTSGSGKGLLAKVTLSMTNTPIPVWPEVKDESEMRKALTTFFIAGHEVLFMDNIKRPIKSGVLAAALTTDERKDRLLGVNRDVVVRIRNSWITTANNPSGDKDILRRCDRIRLIPKTEHPENRLPSDFAHVLPAWAIENRDRLMHALIVLVQHWLAEGKPLPKRVQPLGSYENWSITIGGILECAGIEGFQANRRNYDAADSETEPWRELIAQWWSKHKSDLVLSKDLFPLAEAIDGFPLKGDTDRGLRTSFASELMKYRERVLTITVSGKLIELQVTLSPEKLHNAAQWQLVEVKADA
jgi:putative DNA primase/helicase